MTSTPVTEAYQDSLYRYQVTATDEDDDSSIYSLKNAIKGTKKATDLNRLSFF